MNNAFTPLLDALQTCLPQGGKIPLHEPCFAGREWEYVKACLDSGWVSSVGSFVDRFEQQLSEFTGVSHAIACVNGTAALHTALLLAGVQAGDEVLTPALTFVATTNAIAYCQAIPHFVDSETVSLGVDAVALEAYLHEIGECRQGTCYNRRSGRPIRALMVMHTFGHPVDLDPLSALCEAHHLVLVEDAAEALGSYYHGRHVGQHGKLTTLSFNGNKIITTGGGGALLTSDPHLAAKAKHLTTTAKLPHPWRFDHDQTGYNYRLPNLNAALGCAQLEQLPGFLTAKRRLAECFQKAVAPLTGVHFVSEPPHTRSNYWLNTLRLDDTTQRDSLLAQLHERGILARPAWTLQNHLPMYVDCPAMPLPVAEQQAAGIINLPGSVSAGL